MKKFIKELDLFSKILLIILLLKILLLFKFKLAIGMGDSMLPTLKNPSVVICMYTDNYEVGDIVMYELEGTQIMHRITQITTHSLSDGTQVRTYQLKGDNNPEPDIFEVYHDNIKCKAIFVK